MSKNFISSLLTPPDFLQIPTAYFEVGDLTVRHIKFGKKGGENFVSSYGRVDLPENTVKEGEIVDENALVSVLKKIATDNKYEFVKAVLPENECFLFQVQVPGTLEKAEEIRQSIEFHLEENVPLPLAETVFGFEEVGCSPDGTVKIVSVFASSRALVDKYISVFGQAGMTLVGFDIESRSVARAVIPQGDMKPYIVVNIRGTGTTISVVDRGLVLFSSTSNVGGTAIEDALRRAQNITALEARKMREKIIDNHIDNNDDVEIFSSLINFASAIKDETERFYSYYMTHRDAGRQCEVERIYLVGKNSLITGFEKYLYMAMKKDVDPANIWINIFNLDKYLPEMSFEDSLDFAGVAGLHLPIK